MVPDLIFDVGMHDASDTAFYLAKGFRVVSIEANSALTHAALARFSEPIARGRLTVVNEGIAKQHGEMDFFINPAQDDWSSFDAVFAARTPGSRIERVYCRPLDDFFERFGVPYYLKVDIEGHDEYCIQAVERSSELPRYVSTEATVTDFGKRMAALGYHGFKMVSQLWHQYLPCPRPPREGSFVEARFTNHCSGPFGEETYGPWLSLEEFTREHERCTRREYEGSLHERLGCPRELFLDSWFDFHARLG